jgi:transposase
MERASLEELIEEGLSQRDIAQRLGCSQATVRHWLQRWDLRTRPTTDIAAGRDARAAGQRRIERHCRTHGLTSFSLDRDGVFRCMACRVVAVAARRRRVKEILVAEAGGCCRICGYDKHVAALQFHHVDPVTKRFGVGGSGSTRGLAALREEAAKCVLLCSNCHAEVEVGFADLPPDALQDHG